MEVKSSQLDERDRVEISETKSDENDFQLATASKISDAIGVQLDSSKNKSASKVQQSKAAKHQKSSGYIGASSFDCPPIGKGCTHSLFLQNEYRTGLQALGAPKINTELGRIVYNPKKRNLKYIR